MGWLKLRSSNRHSTAIEIDKDDDRDYFSDDLKTSVSHIEDIGITRVIQNSNSFLPRNHPRSGSDELPFIPPETVNKHTGDDGERLWIVIDDIVYDVTYFMNDHPGGDRILKYFAGQNCSWQFWKFHNRNHLEEAGAAFRIGRTRGLANRWSEPKSFLKTVGTDSW
ncbi:hypothetical protein RUND412_007652 [Rhizina undulata]